MTGSSPAAIPMNTIRDATLEDPQLSATVTALENGDWSGVCDTYKNIRYELTYYSGVLIRGVRVVIPEKLREDIVRLAHEGHPGAAKMKERLRRTMWFPRMDIIAEKMCQNCKQCAMMSLPNPPLPMKRRELPTRPWEAIAIDYKQVDKEMVLVIVDYYSRYIVYEVVTPATAGNTAAALRKYFSFFGTPHIIQCDNGRHFLGEFIELCEEFGIKISRSAPYYPQANGEVERANREFKSVIIKALNENLPWQKGVTDYLLMYHNSTHSSLGGKTPAEAFFNRALADKLPNISMGVHPEDERIRDCDSLQKQKSISATDKKRRARLPDIEIGDVVMTQNLNRTSLTPVFGPEEFVVTELNGPEAVIESIKPPEKQYRRITTQLKRVREKQTGATDENEDDSNVFSEGERAEEENIEEISEPPKKRVRKAPKKLNL